MEMELAGLEMDKIYATFRILSKRKVVVSIIRLHSNYSLNTTTMKFLLATATHTLIQIALSYYKDFANLKARIESGKQLFVRLLLATIAKWQSLQISAQGLKRLQ